MGTWKNHIETLKNKYIGKKVKYNGGIYTIVNVDYNGIIHIDLPTEHNATTAVFESYEADKAIIQE